MGGICGRRSPEVNSTIVNLYERQETVLPGKLNEKWIKIINKSKHKLVVKIITAISNEPQFVNISARERTTVYRTGESGAFVDVFAEKIRKNSGNVKLWNKIMTFRGVNNRGTVKIEQKHVDDPFRIDLYTCPYEGIKRRISAQDTNDTDYTMYSTVYSEGPFSKQVSNYNSLRVSNPFTWGLGRKSSSADSSNKIPPAQPRTLSPNAVKYKETSYDNHIWVGGGDQREIVPPSNQGRRSVRRSLNEEKSELDPIEENETTRLVNAASLRRSKRRTF